MLQMPAPRKRHLKFFVSSRVLSVRTGRFFLNGLHNLDHPNDDQDDGPEASETELRENVAQQEEHAQYDKNQWPHHLRLLLLRFQKQHRTQRDQHYRPESAKTIE